jgi:hypothetical protein
MSSQPVWVSLEPEYNCTRVMATQAGPGVLLKARLAAMPKQPGALALLLEALSAWQGVPLFAALDVEGEAISQQPEAWAGMVGEAAARPSIHVEWCAPPPRWRDRYFEMGDFSSARRLLTHSATGLR